MLRTHLNLYVGALFKKKKKERKETLCPLTGKWRNYTSYYSERNLVSCDNHVRTGDH